MPRRFKAATWNMGGGENPGPTDDQAARVIKAVAKTGTSLFLTQESQDLADRLAIRDLGFRVHRAGPDSMVAWDPQTWTPLAKMEVVLNPSTPFFRVGKTTPVFIHMPEVVLGDKEGRTIRVGSYHTPSSVQEDNAPARRRAALEEAMTVLSARGTGSLTDAVLFGGDDNVDETGAYGPWDFMGWGATGLALHQAPRNTLGRRKVDDFRSRGLNARGRGQVIDGPTHHNAYVQKFVWA
ncbi:MAG: hypothetical protein ABGW82_10040 [Paracoccus sp. (in: a-proteobacteria)]